MSIFSSFKSDPLPERYQEFIRTQQKTIDEILMAGNIGVDPAKDHRDGLTLLLNGKPGDAIDHLYNAHLKYDKIDVENCTADLLKAKGDCILDAIIISNLYEKKYDISEYNPDSTDAFVYLWLSFELSHIRLLASLVSLSELFLFFVEGNMIMIGGSIQTMPPSNFPEFFSVVCHYWRNVYAAQALRSLGSSDTRYLKKLDVELTQEEIKQKLYFETDINSADKRIEELAIVIGDKYGHLIPALKDADYKVMLSAVQSPISENDNTTYLKLFDIMIRNFKKSSAGKVVTDLFKKIPISIDDAFKNENHYGLFTLVYTDMYNKENKKSDTEVSDELFRYAVQYFNDRNHGIAVMIAEEALLFNRDNESVIGFIEDNGSALMEKELGINVRNDDLF